MDFRKRRAMAAKVAMRIVEEEMRVVTAAVECA
jgi:hypothetical protein